MKVRLKQIAYFYILISVSSKFPISFHESLYLLQESSIKSRYICNHQTNYCQQRNLHSSSQSASYNVAHALSESARSCTELTAVHHGLLFSVLSYFSSFFLNCIYWLEAIESNWMKRPVIYERLSGANYLSIHSVLSLHSFIIHSRRCTGAACIAVVKAHSIDRWLSKL